MKIIIRVLFILFLVASPLFISTSKAGGMGPGGGGSGGNPCGGIFPPCPVPLNNGVILLLIAGGAYGGYKLYTKFKKNPA
jgi:hypothetical protein